MSFNKNGIINTLSFQELPTLPSGYKYCEYIESTGTQYIDTGCHFLYGDSLYFDFMKTAELDGENKGYGAGTSASTNITGGGRRYNTNLSNYIASTQYYYSPAVAFSSILNKRMYEIWSMQNSIYTSTLYSYDSLYLLTLSCSISTSFDSGNNVLICKDGRSDFPYPSAQRIYKFVLIRQGGSYACCFQPALRTSDSKPGLFDTVTQTFFTNAGTGEFSYKLLCDTPMSVNQSGLITSSDFIEY